MDPLPTAMSPTEPSSGRTSSTPLMSRGESDGDSDGAGVGDTGAVWEGDGTRLTEGVGEAGTTVLRMARTPAKAPNPIPAATRQTARPVATIPRRARWTRPGGTLLVGGNSSALRSSSSRSFVSRSLITDHTPQVRKGLEHQRLPGSRTP